MRKVFGTRGGALLLPAVAVALGAAVLAPQRARAQFFWDQPRLSADDAARAVMQRGFRPIHRPFRNNDVYVADVIDRRGRQERLIVSADSGDVVQRFFVEGGRAIGPGADPTIPPGPVPPANVPNADKPSLFSRLFGGDDAGQKPEPPPQFAPNYALPPPAQPRPRPKRVPRVVERAPETVAPSSPVESAPLAPANPAQPAPAAPAVTSAPPTAQPSEPGSGAPPDKPRAVNKDPLAIPGSKEDDEKSAPKPATFAVARPAPKPAPVGSAAAAKPPGSKSVPVAPLD